MRKKKKSFAPYTVSKMYAGEELHGVFSSLLFLSLLEVNSAYMSIGTIFGSTMGDYL